MTDHILISQPSKEELTEIGVFQWPIWSCEISEFPWEYSVEESCLILEGDIKVQTDQETVHIKPGDFVIFPSGLKCTWKIIKPVAKHFSFT
ncbi:MAG: cupin domain-containing protein [Candidatus Marinimicrobia bacterium]|jgi:hypothetical protein|nr:cupin domain-containing protein [Candidatus Neomarinimicrobiota bacterium]MBT3617673.1 cupin domain-containing protein [Candidatus Neomarinimicrobiota bacterium]MBT3829053.1 cupin domain-containing protein [Candidatus Neomarinimicrobiota bacterium]MBT3997765.1 cupin domain-containing protein [Candidatus Neomarinimicrobiota bacterium]MBT4281348.1 cupin domain-containing protein [Candidatus Neomarinimicrobiota bacterium]